MKRVKNILIVTHHYPPHISGVGMIAQNHAKRLAALGHKVTVISSETSPQEKSRTENGVEVISIKAWNGSENWGAPFPIFSPKLFSALSKAVKKADIVHIHDAFYMSSFFAALYAHYNKKPLVLMQHVSMIVHPSKIIVSIQKIVYRTSGALIFRLSNVILTYNERIEKFLISRGVSKSKLLELTNGVDTELFHSVASAEKKILRKKFGFDSTKKVILFVGRFVPKKGLDRILAVRNEEYQIACAGGDAPKEKLDNVVFLGKLDQKTLVQAYQAADIFLLPSESEGFPLSIQEAMASSLPIIATNDTGYERYHFDKKLISLLWDIDETNLKQAIRNVLHDEKHFNAMALYSRNFAENNFSWSQVISHLDNIYENLLISAIPKKKIVMLSDAVYPFNKGGKEKRIYEITTRLAAQGYEVMIYCMKWWKDEKTITKDGVKFYAISPYYPLYAGNRRSIKEAIYFAFHCLKLLNKDFDVIEIDHMPHLVLFTVKIICILKGKRMIVTWHEVWGKEYWKRYLKVGGTLAYWIEKTSVRLPDLIISVSDHTTKNLIEVLKAKKPIVTISNGIDMAEIIAATPAAKGADIVFAGRLLSHKNIDVLLEAMSILIKHDPKISLFIIGEGPEKKSLEKMTADLKLSKNVSFLGFLSDYNELYGILLSSKIFALPSTREGFGISILEANASGMPVITIDHKNNAAKDLVINGENGILTALDAQQIATAAQKLLATKKDRANYQKYAEKYNWDTIVSEIKKIYAI